MKRTIARIEVWNIRGFEHAAFDIPTDGGIFEGANEEGKTTMLLSLFSAIKTRENRLDPDVADMVRHDQESGRILVTLDDGTTINRVLKPGRAKDKVSVNHNERLLAKPVQFLSELGMGCQIDPLKFIGMSQNDQVMELCKILSDEEALTSVLEQISKVFTNRTDISRDRRAAQSVLDEILREKADLEDSLKPFEELPSTNDINESLRLANEKNLKKQDEITTRTNAIDSIIRLRGTIAETNKALAQAAQEEEADFAALQRRHKKETQDLTARWKEKKDSLTIKKNEANDAISGLSIIAESKEQKLIPISKLIDEQTKAIERDRIKVLHDKQEERRTKQTLKVKKLGLQESTCDEELTELRTKPGEIASRLDIPGLEVKCTDGPRGTVKFQILYPDESGTVIPITDHSESSQLLFAIRVATQVSGTLGTVAVDGLESCSPARLKTIKTLCKKQGVQLIGTRVTKDGLTMKKV